MPSSNRNSTSYSRSTYVSPGPEPPHLCLDRQRQSVAQRLMTNTVAAQTPTPAESKFWRVTILDMDTSMCQIWVRATESQERRLPQKAAATTKDAPAALAAPQLRLRIARQLPRCRSLLCHSAPANRVRRAKVSTQEVRIFRICAYERSFCSSPSFCLRRRPLGRPLKGNCSVNSTP